MRDAMETPEPMLAGQEMCTTHGTARIPRSDILAPPPILKVGGSYH